MKLKFVPIFFSLSNLLIYYIDGNWGAWSSWTSCNTTCGGGTQGRTRNCDSPAPSNGGLICAGSGTENQACNTAACTVSEYFCVAQMMH
jgi:hypothetical protein